MIDLAEFLWSFSLISLILHTLPVLREAVSMALSSSSASSSSSSPTFSWAGLRSPVFAPKSVIFAPVNRQQESSGKETNPIEDSRFELPTLASGGPVLVSCSEKCLRENSCSWPLDHVAGGITFATEKNQQENLHCGSHEEESSMRDDATFAASECPRKKMVSMPQGFNSPATSKVVEVNVLGKVRKRPARIAIPESYRSSVFDEVSVDLGEKEFQAEGRDFYMVSRRGGRKAMEDGYGVITDVLGDSKQAFFGVFDGHGGRAAVDYVTEKLGQNIITAIRNLEEAEDQVQQAIRAGYLTTDKEFLSQGVSSGACASTVFLKDGELHVANVGDCRVVLSRNGIANALTRDHRPESEDERIRIENSGGYVNCCNGVWRVQGSLAVSRAIGDVHLKDWIISEPETNQLRLTSDCEFLIIASDGLWEKVTNQEAVDVVMRHKNSIESCKTLVDISSSRGCKDDITVMVVYLQNFTETCD
ncbi:probable protein phosphatase 2C 74 [Magnolia sinica]|uniref:probable protein phosphatase 2C 74 n=1 Tax=Magnolia sinica TaxID=86752 RepID=UPI00265A7E42|nr:probable protein phosphatase 2C 74 [Magnolia sinica]